MKDSKTLSAAARIGKAAIREILPPVITRTLRRIAQPAPTSTGPLSMVSKGKNAAVLSSGRRFFHRGTPADLGVLGQVFSERDYDFARLRRAGEIGAFYDRCVDPLIVDAGANIGAAAIWFSHTFDRARVVAIEPDAANFDLLQRNAVGTSIRGVCGAIAGQAGMLALLDPGEGEWGYRTAEVSAENALVQVRAYTLDELLAQYSGTPFVLKIDIEGAEADLFSVPSEALDRFPVIIIELHDWLLPGAASSRPFLQWHGSRDRDFVHCGENVFSLSNKLLGA